MEELQYMISIMKCKKKKLKDNFKIILGYIFDKAHRCNQKESKLNARSKNTFYITHEGKNTFNIV